MCRRASTAPTATLAKPAVAGERRRKLAYYLYQAAYTPEAWAAQIKNPQDVRQRVQAVMGQNGGKLVGVWYAFGEYDLVGIGEYLDNVSAATVSVTFAAGGALRVAKTTPLMTIEEGIEAIPTCAGRSDFGPAICLGDCFSTQRPRDLRSSQGQATDPPRTANALRNRDVAVSGDKRAVRPVLTRLRTIVAFSSRLAWSGYLSVLSIVLVSTLMTWGLVVYVRKQVSVPNPVTRHL